MKWVRDAAVLTAVIASAAAILYLQYRKRGASWSRTVAFGSTGCAIAAWVFMPPWMALAFQIHLSKHVSEFSTVEIVPDLGTKQLSVRHPNWTADPHLFLPLLVKALPDSVDIRADTLAVSLRARDGRTWNSDVAGVRKSSTATGTMALEAEIVMPRSYFDGEHGQPL